MKSITTIVLLLSVVCMSEARDRRSRRTMQYFEPAPVRVVEQAKPAPEAVKPAKEETVAKGEICTDALAEVNAERAKRGLPAFQHDKLLTQAALACAKQRAAQQIHGHLSSDFDYLPAGGVATAAGCGALEPSWGWGTCCTYDSYTYGGAAWVMGSDGRRYMHLFVR